MKKPGTVIPAFWECTFLSDHVPFVFILDKVTSVVVVVAPFQRGSRPGISGQGGWPWGLEYSSTAHVGPKTFGFFPIGVHVPDRGRGCIQ